MSVFLLINDFYSSLVINFDLRISVVLEEYFGARIQWAAQRRIKAVGAGYFLCQYFSTVKKINTILQWFMFVVTKIVNLL
jgi:hypothetical protein